MVHYYFLVLRGGVVTCGATKKGFPTFFNHCPFFEAIVAPSLVIIMEERHIMNGDSHLRQGTALSLQVWLHYTKSTFRNTSITL